MNLWFYLTGTEQTLRADQISYNIVQDEDLRDKLEDIINNVHKPMVLELTDFLRMEGVPLPDSTPQKTGRRLPQHPDGARLTDKEVANLISYNLVVGMMSAARGDDRIRPSGCRCDVCKVSSRKKTDVWVNI